MRWLLLSSGFLALLFLTGCQADYDIKEVAPAEFLESPAHEHADDHGEAEAASADEASVDEQMEESHAGHVHAAGNRNHGTQWFFDQPWAARFIWGKLFRDALIFLALAVVIFVVTGRRKNR